MALTNLSNQIVPPEPTEESEKPILPKIGGIQVEPVTNQQYRMTMLLWGQSGCGKTTWLQTLPKPILWINFDDNGLASVNRDPNIIVANFAGQTSRIVSQFDKFGSGAIADIDRVLTSRPDTQSVVFDSVTTYQQQTVLYAIEVAKTPGATHDNPGPGGYGVRNRQTLYMVQNMLMVTGKHNKHMIFVCHEDAPKTDEKGVIVAISLLLGGSLPTEVPLKISEVWYMRDKGTSREVVVRNAGVIKPMRSRMFDNRSSVAFTCTYDAIAETGIRIEDLYDKWKANNFAKIAVPK